MQNEAKHANVLSVDELTLKFGHYILGAPMDMAPADVVADVEKLKAPEKLTEFLDTVIKYAVKNKLDIVTIYKPEDALNRDKEDIQVHRDWYVCVSGGAILRRGEAIAHTLSAGLLGALVQWAEESGRVGKPRILRAASSAGYGDMEE